MARQLPRLFLNRATATTDIDIRVRRLLGDPPASASFPARQEAESSPLPDVGAPPGVRARRVPAWMHRVFCGPVRIALGGLAFLGACSAPPALGVVVLLLGAVNFITGVIGVWNWLTRRAKAAERAQRGIGMV